jgi:phosphate transport system permease protein
LFTPMPNIDNLARRNRHSQPDRSDLLFRYLIYAASGVSVVVLLLMGWTITGHALPAMKQFGWGFLVGRDWNVPDLKFGALPLIYGTVGSGLISLIFAVPVGLAVAIITSEDLLPKWLRSTIAFTIELSTCTKLITHIIYYNISKLSDLVLHKLLKCLFSEKSTHCLLSY